VDAEVDLPQHPTPAKTLLRMRLPDDRRIVSARAGDRELDVIEGQTLDLSGLSGHVTIRARVGK
jgi:hypothetical protein